MNDASPDNGTARTQSTKYWFDNPYLMGSMSLTIINLVSVLLSLLFIFCRLHHIQHCSLFLIEMAVGSLMSEAIMYLLPSVIISCSVPVPRYGGVPVHFPRLAVVVGLVCLLHALDTASVVFFGRTQSRSHAMEWRNSHQAQQQQEQQQQQQQQQQEQSEQQQQQQQQEQSEQQQQQQQQEQSEQQQQQQQQQQQEQSEQQQQQQQQEQSEQQQQQIVSQEADFELDVAGLFPNAQSVRSDVKSNKSDVKSDKSDVKSDKSDVKSDMSSDGKSMESGKTSIRFENGFSADTRGRFRTGPVNLQQAVANPKLFLQPGPYRLCSIMSAGAILHNFANGVALGAGFVKSWKTGFHLSLSVGMHELAHNVAEFAVLTASGFSLVTILMINVLNWLASFLGVFIAVPLTQKSQNLWAWLMTVATAVFVYLALVTMSSMVRKNYLPQHITAFLIGNAALTTGSLVTVLASATEFIFKD